MSLRTTNLLRFRLLLLASAAILFALTTARLSAQDLKTVLARLDTAAADFHTVSADFQFDSIVTDPIPDKTVQKGTVYYSRRGSDFQIGAHITKRMASRCRRFTHTQKASSACSRSFPTK